MKIRGISSLADAGVGATSKALRTTPTDRDGRILPAAGTILGSYLAGWIFRNTGATAANTQFFGIVNTSPSTVLRVRAVRSNVMFDGTAPGAQGRRYVWVRTTGQFSSGTNIVATKKRSADPSAVAELRFSATGVGGPTFLDSAGTFPALWVTAISIDTTGKFQYFEFPRHTGFRATNADVFLKYNEGLGLINGDAAVAGLGNCGYIEWDEVSA